ncbi:hypothetical protein CapIbe_014774 [Capra ibex]
MGSQRSRLSGKNGNTVRSEGAPAFPGWPGRSATALPALGSLPKAELYSALNPVSVIPQRAGACFCRLAPVNVGVQIPGRDPPLNSSESVPEVQLLDPAGVLCLMF